MQSRSGINMPTAEAFALLMEWCSMLASGIPANSQCRKAIALRRRMLDAGMWEHVYSGLDSNHP